VAFVPSRSCNNGTASFGEIHVPLFPCRVLSTPPRLFPSFLTSFCSPPPLSARKESEASVFFLSDAILDAALHWILPHSASHRDEELERVDLHSWLVFDPSVQSPSLPPCLERCTDRISRPARRFLFIPVIRVTPRSVPGTQPHLAFSSSTPVCSSSSRPINPPGRPSLSPPAFCLSRSASSPFCCRPPLEYVPQWSICSSPPKVVQS